jgi:hypothetical protein
MARGQWIKCGEAMGTIEAVISCLPLVQDAEPVARQPTAPPDSSMIARILSAVAFRSAPHAGQHHVPSSALSASRVTRKHRAAWR